MWHFLAQNSLICSEQFFFSTNHYYYFHVTIDPFHWAKFKKKFLQRIQSYDDASFLVLKWSICPKQKKFLKKIIKIISIYLLASFVLQNFKKTLNADPELWGCVSFGPKTAHLPK